MAYSWPGTVDDMQGFRTASKQDTAQVLRDTPSDIIEEVSRHAHGVSSLSFKLSDRGAAVSLVPADSGATDAQVLLMDTP